MRIYARQLSVFHGTFHEREYMRLEPTPLASDNHGTGQAHVNGSGTADERSHAMVSQRVPRNPEQGGGFFIANEIIRRHVRLARLLIGSHFHNAFRWLGCFKSL